MVEYVQEYEHLRRIFEQLPNIDFPIMTYWEPEMPSWFYSSVARNSELYLPPAQCKINKKKNLNECSSLLKDGDKCCVSRVMSVSMHHRVNRVFESLKSAHKFGCTIVQTCQCFVWKKTNFSALGGPEVAIFGPYDLHPMHCNVLACLNLYDSVAPPGGQI